MMWIVLDVCVWVRDASALGVSHPSCLEHTLP